MTTFGGTQRGEWERQSEAIRRKHLQQVNELRPIDAQIRRALSSLSILRRLVRIHCTSVRLEEELEDYRQHDPVREAPETLIEGTGRGGWPDMLESSEVDRVRDLILSTRADRRLQLAFVRKVGEIFGNPRRFTRLTSDGGFMPPKDRTSLYKLRKFEDGWCVTGMSALPAGARMECPSS